jgi:mannose-6-phosphate isomerase-like protein (cupin superfamily)
MRMNPTISHIVLRKRVVEADWKLALPELKNNGRRHVVTKLWSAKERDINELGDPEWAPGPEDGRTPVLVTCDGGTEIATFTEDAGQDRHMHLVSTETYTVLKGALQILIDDRGPLKLSAGDEVIILPGTVHEIVRGTSTGKTLRDTGREPALLVRVHAVQCQGEADKYVQLQPHGDWLRWSDLSKEDRTRAFKKQPDPNG